MRVRVLTMNVQNEAGDPGRTGLFNRELRRLDPDLVALQEVCWPGFGGRADHLSDLVAGTGLHTTHHSDVLETRPPHADRFGASAVATRWPHRPVPAAAPGTEGGSDDVPPVAVTLTVPGAGDLLFVGAAFSWELDAEAARERQALAVAELDARHRGAVPTLVAGDLNATPDAASVRFLTGRQSLAGRSVHFHDAWEVAGDGPGHTWSVDNAAGAAEIARLVGQPGHRRRIDYVLVGSARAHKRVRARILGARLVGDRPVDGVWLSDHTGVLVDLDVVPAPRAR